MHEDRRAQGEGVASEPPSNAFVFNSVDGPFEITQELINGHLRTIAYEEMFHMGSHSVREGVLSPEALVAAALFKIMKLSQEQRDKIANFYPYFRLTCRRTLLDGSDQKKRAGDEISWVDLQNDEDGGGIVNAHLVAEEFESSEDFILSPDMFIEKLTLASKSPFARLIILIIFASYLSDRPEYDAVIQREVDRLVRLLPDYFANQPMESSISAQLFDPTRERHPSQFAGTVKTVGGSMMSLLKFGLIQLAEQGCLITIGDEDELDELDELSREEYLFRVMNVLKSQLHRALKAIKSVYDLNFFWHQVQGISNARIVQDIGYKPLEVVSDKGKRGGKKLPTSAMKLMLNGNGFVLGNPHSGPDVNLKPYQVDTDELGLSEIHGATRSLLKGGNQATRRGKRRGRLASKELAQTTLQTAVSEDTSDADLIAAFLKKK